MADKHALRLEVSPSKKLQVGRTLVRFKHATKSKNLHERAENPLWLRFPPAMTRKLDP